MKLACWTIRSFWTSDITIGSLTTCGACAFSSDRVAANTSRTFALLLAVWAIGTRCAVMLTTVSSVPRGALTLSIGAGAGQSSVVALALKSTVGAVELHWAGLRAVFACSPRLADTRPVWSALAGVIPIAHRLLLTVGSIGVFGARRLAVVSVEAGFAATESSVRRAHHCVGHDAGARLGAVRSVLIGFAFSLVAVRALVAGFALTLAGFRVARGVRVLELKLEPRTSALFATLKSEPPPSTSDIALLSSPPNTLALSSLTIAVLVVQTLTLLGTSGSEESHGALFFTKSTVVAGFAETLSIGVVAGGSVLADAFEFAVGAEFALLALIQTELSAPSITAHTLSLSIAFSAILTWTRLQTVGPPFVVGTLLLASFPTES